MAAAAAIYIHAAGWTSICSPHFLHQSPTYTALALFTTGFGLLLSFPLHSFLGLWKLFFRSDTTGGTTIFLNTSHRHL